MKNKSIYKTPAGEKEVMSYYDSVLNKWPVPFETKILTTRQGKTFIIKCGQSDAPALILLHGAASNATSWMSDVSAYSKNFCVLAVDIPGEPGKSDQIRPSWQGLQFAEWLEDVYYELNIVKASLLGISQGAWIALRFASFAPEKVERLVLLTPAGIVPTKLSFIFKAVLFSFFGGESAKRLNRFILGKQSIHPTAIECMDLIMTHFNARIEKEYIFSDSELMKLNMSVLLLGGKEDVVRSCKEIARRMSTRVPHLKVIIFPGMGHVLINMTQHVIPFLKQN